MSIDPTDPTEPGRYVNASGQIITVWPPQGRFVDLWRKARLCFTDAELHDLLALIDCWRDENATLVAYTQENGDWVEIAPLPDTVPDEWEA